MQSYVQLNQHHSTVYSNKRHCKERHIDYINHIKLSLSDFYEIKILNFYSFAFILFLTQIYYQKIKNK